MLIELWIEKTTYYLHNLTHFIPLVSLYAPWKHQKTRGFLFSGGIERDQWHKIGWVLTLLIQNGRLHKELQLFNFQNTWLLFMISFLYIMHFIFLTKFLCANFWWRLWVSWKYARNKIRLKATAEKIHYPYKSI